MTSVNHQSAEQKTLILVYLLSGSFIIMAVHVQRCQLSRIRRILSRRNNLITVFRQPNILLRRKIIKTIKKTTSKCVVRSLSNWAGSLLFKSRDNCLQFAINAQTSVCHSTRPRCSAAYFWLFVTEKNHARAQSRTCTTLAESLFTFACMRYCKPLVAWIAVHYSTGGIPQR